MKNSSNISRRKFLSMSGALAGTAIINPVSSLYAAEKISADHLLKKTRVALVGTGHRGTGMWGKSVVGEYAGFVQFVGLCDKNPGRLEVGRQLIGTDCPVYTDFEKMMLETKPEVLIVTTDDNTHDYFISRGMELGADIISEKPMATDERKIQTIIDAEKRTGKTCRVTFNYRYSPHRAKMWEILRSGEIGQLTSVDFHWYLDTSHGADYFRRWHRLVEKSGSLWVHKASHHFDLLNWWIESDPESVYALGDLEFYGKNLYSQRAVWDRGAHPGGLPQPVGIDTICRKKITSRRPEFPAMECAYVSKTKRNHHQSSDHGRSVAPPGGHRCPHRPAQ